MCSLPEDNSDLEQVAVKTQEEDLAGNSDAFISTLGTPSTVHVITNVSSSQCKMLSNRLMQAKCLQWKEQFSVSFMIISKTLCGQFIMNTI